MLSVFYSVANNPESSLQDFFLGTIKKFLKFEQSCDLYLRQRLNSPLINFPLTIDYITKKLDSTPLVPMRISLQQGFSNMTQKFEKRI